MKRKFWTKPEREYRDGVRRLSRRDFLRAGVQAAAMTAMPAFLRQVFAETSALAARGAPSVGCVQIHLGGGAGPHVFPFPLTTSGSLLTGGALGVHGFATNFTSLPGTLTEIGGVQFPVVHGGVGSDFTTALISGLSSAELARVLPFSVAVNSNDDTSTGASGCTTALTAAGFNSPLVNAIGLSATDTGMPNVTAVTRFKSSAFYARTAASIRGLDRYGESLSSVSTGKIDLMAKAIKAISEERLKDPRVAALPEQRRAAILQAHADNLNRVTPTLGNSLDPRRDTTNTIANIFNIVGTTPDTNTDYIFAMALEYLLAGQTGFVAHSSGGYDYHGQQQFDTVDGNGNVTATGTRTRDRRAGELLNKVIRAAFGLGKDLVILVSTDGACSGNPDHTAATVWTGDRGVLGRHYALYVLGNPATSVPTRRLVQVGGYRTDTGTVNDSYTYSKNDVSAAAVLAAFLLRLNGVAPSDIVSIFPVFKDAASLQAVMPFQIG